MFRIISHADDSNLNNKEQDLVNSINSDFGKTMEKTLNVLESVFNYIMFLNIAYNITCLVELGIPMKIVTYLNIHHY